MNKKSLPIFLGAMTALLLAGPPATMAADSAAPDKGKSLSEKVQSMRNGASDKPGDVSSDMDAVRPSPGITDSDLAERARRALETYTDISVDAHNGIVNVSGHVKTGSEKNDILKRVRNVQGVRAVTDGITISDSGPGGMGSYIDDASITTVVKGKFLGQNGLDSMDISVETSNGVVILTGEVESNSQVGLAEGVAKGANGVKDVVNHLSYRQ